MMMARIRSNNNRDDALRRRKCCTTTSSTTQLSWPTVMIRTTTRRKRSCSSLVQLFAETLLLLLALLTAARLEPVTASVAALDMLRGFDDLPLRGADSSRQQSQQHQALLFRRQFRRSAPTARSSWRMLHRAPTELLSSYCSHYYYSPSTTTRSSSSSSSRGSNVLPAHAASLNDLLFLGRRGATAVTAGGRHRSQQRHYYTTTTTTQLISSSSSKNPQQKQQQPIVAVDDHGDDYNYDDLTWLGKFIAGTVEIGFTVLMEYASGFVGGYVLGGLTDIPRFVRQSTGVAQQQQQFWFWREFAGRAARTNAKAARWGRSWGGISAAFGGFDVAVRILRNGKKDEWNTVFSSVAAGAWFARKGQCVVRCALCVYDYCACIVVLCIVLLAFLIHSFLTNQTNESNKP